MTQSELADRLNVTRAAVSNWETEKNYPDLQVIVDISEELDISLNTLLKGDTNVVEKIATDTKESKKLRKKSKILISIVIVLAIVLGCFSAYYFAVMRPKYMTYKESGLYVEDNILMTNENYHSFHSFDSVDNKTAFIYLTTNFYEKHKKEKTDSKAIEVVDLHEFTQPVVRDENGNVAVSDEITAVYYVPKSAVEQLNKKDGYWGGTTEEEKEKMEQMKSESQLVWKSK